MACDKTMAKKWNKIQFQQLDVELPSGRNNCSINRNIWVKSTYTDYSWGTYRERYKSIWVDTKWIVLYDKKQT